VNIVPVPSKVPPPAEVYHSIVPAEEDEAARVAVLLAQIETEGVAVNVGFARMVVVTMPLPPIVDPFAGK
jgi:hypothetical protein